MITTVLKVVIDVGVGFKDLTAVALKAELSTTLESS
jgi:hypothetical protein